MRSAPHHWLAAARSASPLTTPACAWSRGGCCWLVLLRNYWAAVRLIFRTRTRAHTRPRLLLVPQPLFLLSLSQQTTKATPPPPSHSRPIFLNPQQSLMHLLCLLLALLVVYCLMLLIPLLLHYCMYTVRAIITTLKTRNNMVYSVIKLVITISNIEKGY